MPLQLNGRNFIDKIDNFRTLGLLGVSDSLAYRTHEIERHHHHYEHFFGVAVSPSGEVHVADHQSTTSFQADAGNTIFGSWLQVLGSSDTPHVGTATHYDFNALMIETVERANTIYLIEVGFGASGAASISDDTITETMYIAPANARSSPIFISTRRQASGTKAWVRILADGADTGKMDFFIGLHEYEG